MPINGNDHEVIRLPVHYKEPPDNNQATFAVQMRYRGRERTTDIPLTDEMVGRLAAEACIRDAKVDEVLVQVLLEIMRGDLFRLIFKK